MPLVGRHVLAHVGIGSALLVVPKVEIHPEIISGVAVPHEPVRTYFRVSFSRVFFNGISSDKVNIESARSASVRIKVPSFVRHLFVDLQLLQLDIEFLFVKLEFLLLDACEFARMSFHDDKIFGDLLARDGLHRIPVVDQDPLPLHPLQEVVDFVRGMEIH